MAFSLGLACSVLYLGAIGDRYGRKMMLILGILVSIPASLAAAWAPNVGVLIVARFVGGVGAGMAYPTTLALIAALWSGPGRTRSIALWSATGGAIAALGPLLAGILLEHYWWGSVFLITLPLAAIALLMAWKLVPAHVNEATEPVDNLGGILTVVLVGSLILAINFAPVPSAGTRSRPGRRERWRPRGRSCCGNGGRPTPCTTSSGRPAGVLGRGVRRDHRFRLADGRDVRGTAVPAERPGVLHGRGGHLDPAGGRADGGVRAAVGEARRGSRRAVHAAGRVRFCLLGFLTMLLLWNEGIPYWKVALAYALVGAGVGFAGTPASHSLTGSVPVTRAGMASGTADLQRDLGGAILQSIFGALLTAGYATAAAAEIAAAPNSDAITASVQSRAHSSRSRARRRWPSSTRSTRSRSSRGAKTAFLHGDEWAYLAGIIAVLVGAALVFVLFPKMTEERTLLADYHAHDGAARICRGPPQRRRARARSIVEALRVI